jgi:hypothetical protein
MYFCLTFRGHAALKRTFSSDEEEEEEEEEKARIVNLGS